MNVSVKPVYYNNLTLELKGMQKEKWQKVRSQAQIYQQHKWVKVTTKEIKSVQWSHLYKLYLQPKRFMIYASSVTL